MAVNVNPPPQNNTPIEFVTDPVKRAYFQGIQTQLFQLWNRTGGASDFLAGFDERITDNKEAIEALTLVVEQIIEDLALLTARVEALEDKAFQVVTITTDTTTEAFKVYDCRNTSTITVTLDLTPELNDMVHIKRSAGIVNIIGTIDGLTNKTINVKYYSMLLIFNGTDWSQV